MSELRGKQIIILKLQNADIAQVMQIWLNGNEDAHPFIPKEYWKSNFVTVREQLLQAEVYVYESDNTVQCFIGLQGVYIAGLQL